MKEKAPLFVKIEPKTHFAFLDQISYDDMIKGINLALKIFDHFDPQLEDACGLYNVGREEVTVAKQILEEAEDIYGGKPFIDFTEEEVNASKKEIFNMFFASGERRLSKIQTIKKNVGCFL